jgi:hypothetical protein
LSLRWSRSAPPDTGGYSWPRWRIAEAEGDDENGGADVDTPNTEWSGAKPTGTTQQVEVLAVHEIEAAVAEANDAAAQLVRLPLTSGR